jgi:hypothetical protein
MKKKLLGIFSLVLASFAMNAQTTAMQMNGLDCNGNSMDVFADLDAGKAVVLFYYMPNCGSCPPHASRIQSMVNNVMNTYPGMVKGYAFPFQNTTTCAYSQSWVTSNSLNFYAPMDSGAASVAYYGGFGMPTVVLLGGLDHRVMFSTLNMTVGDTTIMRDSILNLFATGVNSLPGFISSFNAFPNPSNSSVQIELNLTKAAMIKLEIVNVLGEIVEVPFNGETAPGLFRKEIVTAGYPNGTYFIRVTSDGEVSSQSFTVVH